MVPMRRDTEMRDARKADVSHEKDREKGNAQRDEYDERTRALFER